ncbi:MAG: dienelactone hydrolase family protein [Solirubrobacteraceae bacterium]
MLFHSAQGLRRDVRLWTESLRAAGHQVYTPDLFEGATFEQLEDGIAHRDQIGIPVLMRRAAAALEELPAQLVYGGFSMGAATAEYYAATRDGARGAVLMHSVAPLKTFGVETWPNGLPVQLHYAVGDPLLGDRRDVDALRVLAAAAGARTVVYEYPGAGHLFADPDGPDYDPTLADEMLQRQLSFLEVA